MCGCTTACAVGARGCSKEQENQGVDHEAHGSWWSGHPLRSSGNRAFDDYKAETLQRLAEEQREFRAFLERLRHARDEEAFARFMADRRASDRNPPQPQGGVGAAPAG